MKSSVVIPTKNRFEFLLRALYSIHNQVEKPSEVVIVDDGSDQPIILPNSLNESLNIRIIRNISSFGGAEARNIGIKSSTSGIIFFLDDDDAWPSDYVKKHMDIHRSSRNCLLYTKKSIVHNNNLDKVIRESFSEVGDILTSNFIGTTSCVSAPKDSLIEVGGFDTNLKAFQDYDLWLRLSRICKVLSIESTSILYTINVKDGHHQISGNYTNHLSALNVFEEKYKSHEDKNKILGSVNFFVAKAIHRKNYFMSLKFSFTALIRGNTRSLALLIPYSIYNKFNIYTS
jgi:glycosyltransferase involved in cell wall biosynthesis